MFILFYVYIISVKLVGVVKILIIKNKKVKK